MVAKNPDQVGGRERLELGSNFRARNHLGQQATEEQGERDERERHEGLYLRAMIAMVAGYCNLV